MHRSSFTMKAECWPGAAVLMCALASSARGHCGTLLISGPSLQVGGPGRERSSSGSPALWFFHQTTLEQDRTLHLATLPQPAPSQCSPSSPVPPEALESFLTSASPRLSMSQPSTVLSVQPPELTLVLSTSFPAPTTVALTIPSLTWTSPPAVSIHSCPSNPFPVQHSESSL